MGTRYNQGDKVELAGSKAEVIGIRNPESASPTYEIRYEDSSNQATMPEDVKASALKKVDRGSGWKADAREQLAKDPDFEGQPQDLDYTHRHAERRGAFSIGSTTGAEYIVFKDHATAAEAAIDEARDRLEVMPESWNDSFIKNFLYISETDKRMIANDEARDRANIQEEDPATDFGNQSREDWEVQKSREIKKRLDDPIQYFIRDRGMYDLHTLINQDFIGIDIDEAAEEAVNTDGAGHFLSPYDGALYETPERPYYQYVRIQ